MYFRAIALRPRLLRKMLGFALVVFILLINSMAAGAAPKSIGGKPAYPDPENLRTRSIFIDVLDKGQSKEDTLLVTNDTNETQTILLLATDGLPTNTGSFSCKQNVEERKGAGSWISLSRSEVSLRPYTETTVDFTINVPRTADVGEHNGCIVMQAKNDKGIREGHINLHFRSAVRVAIVVPGDVFKKLSFESFAVQTNHNRQLYKVTLGNEGNVSVDADLSVELDNFFGHTIYRNGGMYPVLPENKLELQFENTQLPFWGGLYWVQATANYNTEPYTFGTHPEDDSYTTIHTGKKLIFIWPQPAGLATIITVLFVIATLISYWWLQKRRRDNVEKNWRTYTVKTNDTLQLIAKNHSISWRKLAWMNRLRAPYSISKGQKIYVPKPKG